MYARVPYCVLGYDPAGGPPGCRGSHSLAVVCAVGGLCPAGCSLIACWLQILALLAVLCAVGGLCPAGCSPTACWLQNLALLAVVWCCRWAPGWSRRCMTLSVHWRWPRAQRVKWMGSSRLCRRSPRRWGCCCSCWSLEERGIGKAKACVLWHSIAKRGCADGDSARTQAHTITLAPAHARAHALYKPLSTQKHALL